MIVALNHVQITVPKDSEADARRFYCDRLGLTEIPKPDALLGRGGFWMELGSIQLHVGTEDGIARHKTKGHIAFEVDDLPKALDLIRGMGLEITESVPVPGLNRFECRDPFGNRLEFLQKTE